MLTITSHSSHSISTLHSKVHHLTTWGYLYNLTLLTILLSWYYSQDSAWYYSQALLHHHLNHMRILARLHISTASPPQSYEDTCRTTQVYCITTSIIWGYLYDYISLLHHHLNHMRILVGLHNSTILILLTRLYNITTSIIWRYL